MLLQADVYLNSEKKLEGSEKIFSPLASKKNCILWGIFVLFFGFFWGGELLC